MTACASPDARLLGGLRPPSPGEAFALCYIPTSSELAALAAGTERGKKTTLSEPFAKGKKTVSVSGGPNRRVGGRGRGGEEVRLKVYTYAA